MDKKNKVESNPKVVLLGANGFVGSNVSKELTRNNIAFSSISKSEGVDLRNYDKTLEAFRNLNPDIIINCAAHVGSLNYVTQQAATIFTDNAKMILNMYESVSVVNPNCLIVNPIANCTYPALDENFQEDDLWKGPVHSSVYAYGGAKRFLLMVAKSFDMQYSIRSVQLLVPNMYGCNDSPDPNKAHALNALISRFVKAEQQGNTEITLWGTGVAIREWLFAADFGKIILQLIKNPMMLGLSEPVNIAQNFGLSVKELVQVIQQQFKTTFTIKWDSTMPDGAPKKVMNDVRFKKIFPAFEFTDFNKGIEQTIEYYKSIYPY